jgi:hypothetical protein
MSLKRTSPIKIFQWPKTSKRGRAVQKEKLKEINSASTLESKSRHCQHAQLDIQGYG